MEHRILGKTGIDVTVLGFGGAEIGFENADQATVQRLLNAALDAGLNVIDTAECYAGSEELIGNAVADRRGEFALFSKVGHASGLPFDDWDPKLIPASIERSLQRLRTDHLDLIQLHSCSEQVLRAGEVVAALEAARAQGKTRFIGYSGDGQAARIAVESGAFDVLQTSVNIADQESIDLLLPLATRHGMGVIAKRPIANAAWRNGRRPENAYHHVYWDRLQLLDYPFLKDEVDSGVDIALRFTLSQPGVHTAIVGTTNPERWRANAALVDRGRLPSATIEQIRQRWRVVSKPQWEGQV